MGTVTPIPLITLIHSVNLIMLHDKGVVHFELINTAFAMVLFNLGIHLDSEN
jgi:hypothetical protein